MFTWLGHLITKFGCLPNHIYLVLSSTTTFDMIRFTLPTSHQFDVLQSNWICIFQLKTDLPSRGHTWGTCNRPDIERCQIDKQDPRVCRVHATYFFIQSTDMGALESSKAVVIRTWVFSRAQIWPFSSVTRMGNFKSSGYKISYKQSRKLW